MYIRLFPIYYIYIKFYTYIKLNYLCLMIGTECLFLYLSLSVLLFSLIYLQAVLLLLLMSGFVPWCSLHDRPIKQTRYQQTAQIKGWPKCSLCLGCRVTGWAAPADLLGTPR